MTLNELGQKVKSYREGVEAYCPDKLGIDMLAKLMRVSLELAEAGEEVRNNDVEAFKEECADTVMQLSDIWATMGFDIEAIIEAKFKKILDNPKGKWHGKATPM